MTEHGNSNISQSGSKGPHIIWQSRFTLVLLQVAFYVKARLCRSQYKYTYFLFRCTQPKVTNFSFITLPKQETQEKLHVYREGSSFNLFSLNLQKTPARTLSYNLHFTRICHMTFFYKNLNLQRLKTTNYII